MKRMNQADVVFSASLMKIKYEQIITLVHDMEALLAEAETYCKDEEVLADMRHTYRMTKHMLTEGAHNDD
jgi:hypothetical protein